MTDPSTLIESNTHPAEVMRQVAAAGWRVTAPRVRHEGSTPKPIFGESVTIRTPESEHHGTNPDLARMASGPTMVCSGCGAVGAGFLYGQAHGCGSEWLPVTTHPTPTQSWHDRHAEVLMSSRWKKLRAEVLRSQGGKCKWCEERKGLQMHHLHYRTMGDESASDVVILCPGHHAVADDYREMESAFDTWHSKKYGEDAEVLSHHQQEFDQWLEWKSHYG